MAKNLNLPKLLFLAALCFCGLLGSGVLSENVRSAGAPSGSSGESMRRAVLDIARAEIGVREATGRNDGARVGEYLRYTDLGEGHEWCAAFVSWCFGQIGLPEPRTPWSPALFPVARQLDQIAYARPGDVFGIWVREKGRIGHAGLIESWDVTGRWYITIEGNNQDAVRRVRRTQSTAYRVADWITAGSELRTGEKGDAQ